MSETSRARRYRRITATLKKQETEIQNRINNHSEISPSASLNLVPQNKSPKTDSAAMKIRLWALKNNITRNALSELLTILISIGLTWLPCDARTLLATPRSTEIKCVANGQMWYNGIKSNLNRILKAIDHTTEVQLNFNVDGVPLFNSSKHEFWPILANLHSKT